MSTLRRLTRQCSISTAIVTVAVFSILTEVIHLEPFLANTVDEQSASYLSGVLIQGVGGGLLIVLIVGMGMGRSAGFTNPREWRQLWLVWPILALSVLAGWSLFDGTIRLDTSMPQVVVLYILVYLSTGFFEEILCRGLLTTAVVKSWGSTRKGLYLSVIVSSMAFGLIHIANYFMGRASLLAVATQVVYATFFGVFFAACLLRNNSIWPAILAHGVFDIFSDLNAISVGGEFGRVAEMTPSDAVSSIIVTAPLFFYGLFILRKVKPVNESPDMVDQVSAG